MSVLRTSPDTFAILEPFDDGVSFEFDRRVSERPASGQLRDAVVVSPRTGEVSVRHRRRGVEVRMEGGFRERTVYRVTLLPTLQDLWDNRLDGPHDLFFSTGPEFEPNVLGGLVTDRLTGEAMDDVRVEAVPLEANGLAHSTMTDSTGIFSFPFLPADRYLLRAYDDLNRNREPDFTEPQDSLEVTVARGDTVIVTELVLLLPDTTPAVLTQVEALDSLSLRLEFDDPLDPERPLDEVMVALSREDGGPVPDVLEVLHLHEWEARPPPEPEEPREEDPGDPEDPDAPPPAEDPEEEPVAEEVGVPARADDDPPLPAFEIFVVLEGPLEVGVEYLVEVEGLTNLNGVPGGGGERTVVGPEPPREPEPEEMPPDTIPPPDTVPSWDRLPPP
jgi:hypothetical protein